MSSLPVLLLQDVAKSGLHMMFMCVSTAWWVVRSVVAELWCVHVPFCLGCNGWRVFDVDGWSLFSYFTTMKDSLIFWNV